MRRKAQDWRCWREEEVRLSLKFSCHSIFSLSLSLSLAPLCPSFSTFILDPTTAVHFLGIKLDRMRQEEIVRNERERRERIGRKEVGKRRGSEIFGQCSKQKKLVRFFWSINFSFLNC